MKTQLRICSLQGIQYEEDGTICLTARVARKKKDGTLVFYDVPFKLSLSTLQHLVASAVAAVRGNINYLTNRLASLKAAAE